MKFRQASTRPAIGPRSEFQLQTRIANCPRWAIALNRRKRSFAGVNPRFPPRSELRLESTCFARPNSCAPRIIARVFSSDVRRIFQVRLSFVAALRIVVGMRARQKWLARPPRHRSSTDRNAKRVSTSRLVTSNCSGMNPRVSLQRPFF